MTVTEPASVKSKATMANDFQAEETATANEIAAVDRNRPAYHVMPKQSWCNDPNGLIYYKGNYHMFYQYVATKPNWECYTAWGHVISRDMVHWRHLPVAIEPNKGSDDADADGCWSGCCVVDDASGVATIIYTGLRLPGQNMNELVDPDVEGLHPALAKSKESVCYAVADPDDDELVKWTKKGVLISGPPKELGDVHGWRDPFMVQHGGNGKPWLMVIGSGTEQRGGTILLYESQHLTHGWQYKGVIASTHTPRLGTVWECPFLVELPRCSEDDNNNNNNGNGCDDVNAGSNNGSGLQKAGTGVSVLTMGAFEGVQHGLQRLQQPVFYKLGTFDGSSFTADSAADSNDNGVDDRDYDGLRDVDLGDALYATNILRDAKGRVIMFAWMRESWHNPEHLATTWPPYSGCMSLPRVLSLRDCGGGRRMLCQQPLPELQRLRHAEPLYHCGDAPLVHAMPTAAGYREHMRWEMECRITRGNAEAVGFLIPGSRTTPVQQHDAAMVLYSWRDNKLQVLSGPAAGMLTAQHVRDVPHDPQHTVGGALQSPFADELRLRAFRDGSLLEVFTDKGEAVSTRVYLMPASNDASDDDMMRYPDHSVACFRSFGVAHIISVTLWELDDIWTHSADAATA